MGEGTDDDGDNMISRVEFTEMLRNVTVCRCLQNVGVDVVGLVDFVDFLFELEDEHDFGHFMQIVLGLRGTNTATVKDVVDMRKFISVQLEDMREHMEELF